MHCRKTDGNRDLHKSISDRRQLLTLGFSYHMNEFGDDIDIY